MLTRYPHREPDPRLISTELAGDLEPPRTLAMEAPSQKSQSHNTSGARVTHPSRMRWWCRWMEKERSTTRQLPVKDTARTVSSIHRSRISSRCDNELRQASSTSHDPARRRCRLRRSERRMHWLHWLAVPWRPRNRRMSMLADAETRLLYDIRQPRRWAITPKSKTEL